jgi:hypothetical protein
MNKPEQGEPASFEQVVEWYASVRTSLPVLTLQAGDTDVSDAIERRRHVEGRDCARCQSPAQPAVVGRYENDVDRLVDLCPDCFLWIKYAAMDHDAEEEPQ